MKKKNWSLANVFQHKLLLEVIPLKIVPRDGVPSEIEKVLGKLLLHVLQVIRSLEQNYSLQPQKRMQF
jgi:hypothetical protein